LAHAGCNCSHLTVSALGVLNGWRIAIDGPTSLHARTRSIDGIACRSCLLLPAVAAAAAEAEAVAEEAAEEELLLSCI
jgi:hypothetical protein